MYIVTTAQMQAAEKTANAAGLRYAQLMENAGQAIATVIQQKFNVADESVLVLVGPGNNGGDGLVVARHLSLAGAYVTVYIWNRPNLESDLNWKLLDNAGVNSIVSREATNVTMLTSLLINANIIVDALLGTGVSRPIEGGLAKLLDQTKSMIAARRVVTESRLIELQHSQFEAHVTPMVIAIDVPSGLNSDTGIADPYTLNADLTVTLAAVKQGHILMHGPEVTGSLIVADIEIKTEHYPSDVTLEMATALKVRGMLPPRPLTAHKSTFGRALLVAGSVNYTGAAMLAARAAARSGVGWVTLACPQVIYPILASRMLEATYLPWPSDAPDEAYQILSKNMSQATSILIGPGLGLNENTIKLILAFLDQHTTPLPPLVIDADGLNILAKQPTWWELLPPYSILTPHVGEMARLMNSSIKIVQSNRLTVAKEMAAQWGQVVLLKGAYTIVAAPDGQSMVLPFATPALAKAGSGDVLSGVIVALRAQGVAPFEAAVAGAYLHGLAGTLAGHSLGVMSVIAPDLINFLPAAIREVMGDNLKTAISAP